MAGNQSRSLAAAGQEPPQYLNLSSWPVDASSYYNYLLHYCNNNSTPAAAAGAACCEWNNCSVAGNIFLEVAGGGDDDNNSGNASDYWINSTNPQRPEDNLIFTSLTSAILGVLILATIVGK